MANWMIWLVLSGVVVALELFTGTFYLLMIGIAFAVAGLAALFGCNPAVQFIVAAIVGVAATYAVRRSKIGPLHHIDPARDPNVNLDIGQTLTIEEWKNSNGNQNTARVMYRGALWDVELAHGVNPQPGLFTIHEIRGSHLIVTNANLKP